MSVIKSITSALRGGQKEQHTYECQVCQTVFDSEEGAVENVSCPNCDADMVRNADAAWGE
ncbi:hypothetical protein [Haloarchaeobius sp. DFWS5]|uniref:hypothetical protein n=1 Tax=Haloarchaeobius sp. DFWS5 TaxID=3446114 RepID=UPI003EBC59AE